MQLKKSERNLIFQALVEAGIDPATCELSIGEKLVLTHPSSNSSFIAACGTGHSYFWGEICVGEDPPDEFNRATWDNVAGYAHQWAKDVAQYVGTPDLWADLQGAKEVLGAGQHEAMENTPFTPAEQAEITRVIRQIKASLKENTELTAKQLSRIEDRLDEAEEASRRIGRKDWLLLFSGTIFTLIVTDCLTPDVAQQVLMVTLHGLSHLFLGGIKPIPGPHLK